MYFITIKRMLEVCFSAHPNIQYRAIILSKNNRSSFARTWGGYFYVLSKIPSMKQRSISISKI